MQASAHLQGDAPPDGHATSLGNPGSPGRRDRQAHHDVWAAVYHEQTAALLSGAQRRATGATFTLPCVCECRVVGISGLDRCKLRLSLELTRHEIINNDHFKLSIRSTSMWFLCRMQRNLIDSTLSSQRFALGTMQAWTGNNRECVVCVYEVQI